MEDVEIWPENIPCITNMMIEALARHDHWQREARTARSTNGSWTVPTCQESPFCRLEPRTRMSLQSWTPLYWKV